MTFHLPRHKAAAAGFVVAALAISTVVLMRVFTTWL
jgi:hypothetical protein